MHSSLCQELEQHRREIKNFPFPDTNSTNTPMYCLREVPVGQGQIGYVNPPHTHTHTTSREVRKFKKEIKSLTEGSTGLAVQLQ